MTFSSPDDMDVDEPGGSLLLVSKTAQSCSFSPKVGQPKS